LKPEVIESTTYHHTGMFAVAGEPVNPVVP